MNDIWKYVMKHLYLYQWRNEFNLTPTAMIHMNESIICWWQEKSICNAYVKADSLEDAYNAIKQVWPEIKLVDLIEAVEEPFLNIPKIKLSELCKNRIRKFELKLH